MTPAELREEIAIELEALAITVDELVTLHQDVTDREPTVREKTAAAAFLAQFYNGLETILKRISIYHNVALRTGETWHIELFRRFCVSSHPALPALFNASLAATLALTVASDTWCFIAMVFSWSGIACPRALSTWLTCSQKSPPGSLRTCGHSTCNL